MQQFVPRLTAPSGNNKYYIKTTFGGYNQCIVINKSTGSVIPNCVGYAWGRFCEEANILSCNLSRGNAENWYGYNDGYKRGKQPKLGAVICWSKGKVGVESDGAGHVGVVEGIHDDEIVVSMSAYGGTRWYTRKFKKGQYNYNGFVFQGFIYNPYIIDEEQPKKDIDTIAHEVIEGKWGNEPTRSKKLEAAGYSYEERCAIQARVNEILSGDTGLKVGDKVEIIKSGNSQANGKGKVAGGIGWKRYIKKIYEGSAYPYQVGDSTGTTGFYKADALKEV